MNKTKDIKNTDQAWFSNGIVYMAETANIKKAILYDSAYFTGAMKKYKKK